MMLSPFLAEWRKLNVYERWYFALALLMALFSNISTAVTSTVIGLSAAVYLTQGWRQKKFPVLDRGIVKVILIYTFVWLVISLYGLEPHVSLKELWATAYRFIPLFLAMIAIKKPWQLRLILLAFALSVTVDMGKGAWQLWSQITEGEQGLVRPTGFNKSPTFLASHMLMAMPILFFAATREYLGARWQKVCFGVGLATVVMLIATQTRGAWLSFLFVWIFYAFVAKNLRRRLILALAGGLSVFVVAMIFLPALQSRVVTLTDPAYRSNSERLLMWESSLEIWDDYPVTGVGMDEFAVVYNDEYISPLAQERPRNPADPRTGHTHPHNNFLKMLTEGGVLGGAVFVWLHIYMAYRLWKVWREEKQQGKNFPWGLAGLLLVLGIHLEGLTDTNITQVSIMREYWFLVGMILIAAPLDSENN